MCRRSLASLSTTPSGTKAKAAHDAAAAVTNFPVNRNIVALFLAPVGSSEQEAFHRLYDVVQGPLH